MQVIDVAVAKEYVQETFPNDPLLMQMYMVLLDALPKINVDSLKSDLDAAITAINQIAEGGHTWMCPYCKNAEKIYSGMCDCSLGVGVCQNHFSKFEWRNGPRLEDSYYD